MATRYSAEHLQVFAHTLLVRAGMAPEMATDVADILLEGDLLGHDTHGLQLLASYLAEVEKGTMSVAGTYVVVNERPACAIWDGRRLPGPWLCLRAVEQGIAKARQYGTGAIVIRRSHHIACLAAYLKRATDQGFVMQLFCSDPNGASVAPFGGTRAVFTPDPLAFGFPTGGDPVLIDISASLTTNGMTNRLHRQGKRLDHPWLIDAKGSATTDPGVLFEKPPGTILPLGGLEAGHKGYGLALIVEAMTGGLAGFGRADAKEGWGATVFVQIIDPDAFGSRQDFERQAAWIAQACRENPPRAGSGASVKLPGQRGLQRRREQLQSGVQLNAEIMPALTGWAEKLQVPLPGAMN